MRENKAIMQKTTRGRSGQGFTIVEILIVVVILGILAAAVIPKFAGASDDTARSAFVTNMQTYAQAARLYMFKTSEYLEDSSSGTCPSGWESYINVNEWVAGTPIGGVWDFELDSFEIKAGFGVHFWGGNTPYRDDAFMQKVDELIDDGDLSTGVFRKIAADRDSYILADS